ncbi:MAG: hypothetical protein HOY78_03380 [Saccharothrix sp.]|nr:hypothetical protein [Saccharothrix sp.]
MRAAGAGEGWDVELRVLGSLEVRGQDRPVRRRTRVLLGVLCLRANAPVSSELLLDALWGAAPPPSAPANLRSSVADLRRIVPAIGSRPGGYVLRADATTLDCLAFTELADEGRKHLESGDFDLAAARLAAASALWRGPVLDGLTVPELVRPAARLLEDRRLEVAEDAVDARLALGDHARLAEELRSSVDEQPLRERRWRQWMVALYRCGRQAEALEAYRELHRLLDDELGVRPGPEARRLHERILSGAPDLDPPPVVVRRPPRQLPPDVPGFVGRAGALAELDVPRGTVVVSAVSGTAGVGKTALAVRWAHAAATRFPDGCLYADLRGFGPGRAAAPEEVLAAFLRALGVGDPPAGAAELSARFRSELSDRRVLVVLDNAASPAQVRPLLAGAPGCRTVVTSRDSLAGLVARDGAHRVHLDLLSPEEARVLLVGLIGERAERDPEAVAELARRCARLPLALRVAAELAVARPDASVRHLVDELAERGLDLLDAGGDGDTAVRAVFSWSVDALPVAAARAFGLLGVHPGREVGLHAAAALLDADLAVTRGVLDVLVRAHLVQPVGPDRFGMHDLLREYAAERADDTGAVRRLLDHYRCAAAVAMDLLYPFESDRRPKPPPSGTPLPLLTVDTAQAWLDAEQANLVAAGVHAAEHGLGTHAVDLSALLWRDFTTGAHYPEAVALHGGRPSRAGTWPARRPRTTCWASCATGWASTRRRCRTTTGRRSCGSGAGTGWAWRPR